MKPINKERLLKYKKLSERKLWDIDNKVFHNFYNRALKEGVELVSNDFIDLGMFRAPHKKSLSNVDVLIQGIPMDIGIPNPRPGTRMAPNEIRKWSLDRNMVNIYTNIAPFDDCNIIDYGDLQLKNNPYNLISNLEEIAECYTIFKQNNIFPLTIGGEHTCTYGILKGLTLNSKSPVCVIQLDAHADTSVSFEGVRISDATFMQCATVDGFIDPEKTIQIGLRGRGLMRSDFSYNSGMEVILAEEVQKNNIEKIIEKTKKTIGNLPVYITLDTDVFDCSVMPGTTLPEPFGLTGIEVRDFIRGIDGMNIIGADIVETSPGFDPTGMSACLVAGIAFELLCVLSNNKLKSNNFKQNRTVWKKTN